MSVQGCNSIDGLRITGPLEDPAGAIELEYTECGGSQVQTASFESEFDGNHLVLGTYHIWVYQGNNGNGGKLKIKDGAPATDAEGTVVGTQS